jgi:MFS family permease
MVGINANLPAYADTIGIDAKIIGWIVAVNPLLSLIFSVPFGYMCDRYNRFVVIFIGLIFYVLSALLLVLYKGIVVFFIVKALEGLALAAYLTAVIALITDVGKKENLSQSIGSFTSISTLGFVIAPIIAAIIGKMWNIEAIFVFVLVCSILNLLLCIPLYVLYRKEVTQKPVFEKPLFQLSGINLKQFKWPVIITLSFLSFAFGYAMSVFDSIWAYYIHDRGGGVFMINFTYFCYALPVVFLSRYMGTLADKYKNLHMPILLGSVVIAISIFSYGFIPYPLIIALVCAVEGAGNAAMFPCANAAILKATDDRFKGRALGIFNSARMGGNFIGAIIAGYLFSMAAVLPFVVSAVLIFIAAILAGITVYRAKLQ